MPMADICILWLYMPMAVYAYGCIYVSVQFSLSVVSDSL